MAPTMAPTVAPTLAPATTTPSVAPSAAPTAAPTANTSSSATADSQSGELGAIRLIAGLRCLQGHSVYVCHSTGDKAHLEMAHLLCMSAGAVQALLAQKAAFSNAGSVSELNSWTQAGNPCSGWSGVTCDQSGNIISLCAPCLADGHERFPCNPHGVSPQANSTRPSSSSSVTRPCLQGTVGTRPAGIPCQPAVHPHKPRQFVRTLSLFVLDNITALSVLARCSCKVLLISVSCACLAADTCVPHMVQDAEPKQADRLTAEPVDWQQCI